MTTRMEAEAALSALPASGWQPIETAPKDGTSILLFDAKAKLVTYGGWVSEVDQGADYEGQGIMQAGWWSIDLSDNRPTHWRPLPQPPVVASPPHREETQKEGAR